MEGAGGGSRFSIGTITATGQLAKPPHSLEAEPPRHSVRTDYRWPNGLAEFGCASGGPEAVFLMKPYGT